MWNLTFILLALFEELVIDLSCCKQSLCDQNELGTDDPLPTYYVTDHPKPQRKGKPPKPADTAAIAHAFAPCAGIAKATMGFSSKKPVATSTHAIGEESMYVVVMSAAGALWPHSHHNGKPTMPADIITIADVSSPCAGTVKATMGVSTKKPVVISAHAIRVEHLCVGVMSAAGATWYCCRSPDGANVMERNLRMYPQ